MPKFEDPFKVTVTPDLCSSGCPPPPEDCLVCGYPSGAYEACFSDSSGCLGGSVECLDCEKSFENLDIKFLGGFVSGFSSRLGFGSTESTVNIDIVLPKYKCPDLTLESQVGVCCLADGSCSTAYKDKEDCENSGGSWKANQSCDDNPCECSECDKEFKYEGKLAYIYTFNMGAFCFRGILSTHNYTEDSGGYRYRITLVDGRSVLSNSIVLLSGTYTNLPKEFRNNALNAVGNEESSVTNNTCGNGLQCKDFMKSGASSSRGIKYKSALEGINGRCISIPVSGAGLKLNVTKLINVVSEDIRTTNTDSSILDLIVSAAEESGYDVIISINNDNEFEVLPINYKRPATAKSLFNFIEDLTAKDIVISKDYGEEMSGTSSKNKRIVFGDNISYLTSVRDFPYQRFCDPIIPSFDNAVCCLPDNSCIESTIDDISAHRANCIDNGGIPYFYTTCDYQGCYMQPVCTIKNAPASIGAYDTFFITPTSYPEDNDTPC
jgi:hypothetical protein